jgi:hemolysin III
VWRTVGRRTLHGVESAAAIPRLRGVVHAWAFWFALAAAVVLVAVASGARARVAASVYGTGLCVLFAASAAYHRWRPEPRWRPLLRRLDHCAIYVFIAASYTPVALLVLHGAIATGVLAGTWAAALAGVALSLAWIDAPRVLRTGCYVALGWIALVAAPQLVERLGLGVVGLLAAGGVLYSLGAAIYATRHPDPWPATFGFHELFHVLVTAAALVHFVAIAGWVIPMPAPGA